MKKRMIIALTTLPAILLAALLGTRTGLQAAGIMEDQGILTAQYIEDPESGKKKKATIQDYMAKPEPRFIMGVSAGLDAREGFGSAFLAAPLGVQYGSFLMAFDISFTYSNAKSLRRPKAGLLDSILRTKLNGHVVEFTLPFKFSYLLLDLEKYPYTPYFTAGIGYGYRKYYLRGSTSLERMAREYSLNSFTMHFGFGFLVRTSEDTRFNVGITGISNFNDRSGEFNYDTTGVSITAGLLLLF